MDEFANLVSISQKLLSDEGCPWDRRQTLFTLQSYLLEETYELIEAIDESDPAKISEELGDVLYALIFISQLGEKQKIFSLSDSIRNASQKLIRRHPHVFGDKKISSMEAVAEQWEEIKKKEGKKNPLAGIPPGLPALARAQKVIHKGKKYNRKALQEKISDDLGQRLWELVEEADSKGIDAESALRRTCLCYEGKIGGMNEE